VVVSRFGLWEVETARSWEEVERSRAGGLGTAGRREVEARQRASRDEAGLIEAILDASQVEVVVEAREEPLAALANPRSVELGSLEAGSYFLSN
jgi:hypothetical protein